MDYLPGTSKSFICISSINPYNNPLYQVNTGIIIPFYRWGYLGLGQFCSFSTGTALEMEELGFQPRDYGSNVCLYHCANTFSKGVQHDDLMYVYIVQCLL